MNRHTCFVCGRNATRTDGKSREWLCYRHWWDASEREQRRRWCAHEFDLDRLWFCLEWQYGSKRRDLIMAGDDSATNEDISRWNSLGA